MKKFTKILLYLSFVFVFAYLYSKDLLVLPELHRPEWFILSIVLLFLGFLFDSKAWQLTAQEEIPRVKFIDAFIGSGKFIFSKYIPGKIWIIIGKATYLNDIYKKSLANLSSLSFFYQLVVIFTASVLSIILVYFIHKLLFWLLIAGLLLLLVFYTLLYKPLTNISSKILSRILKKEIQLPEVSMKTTTRVFMLALVNWILWSVSFYLFLLSVLPSESVSLAMGFLFPVSSVVGIVVLIAPGGLGVREGFLVLGLAYFNILPQEAAAVAFISRLWFLSGEFLFFITAFLMSFRRVTDNTRYVNNYIKNREP